MTKEEVKQYIKENLEISVSVNWAEDYITVKLLLEHEVISEETENLLTYGMRQIM